MIATVSGPPPVSVRNRPLSEEAEKSLSGGLGSGFHQSGVQLHAFEPGVATDADQHGVVAGELESRTFQVLACGSGGEVPAPAHLAIQPQVEVALVAAKTVQAHRLAAVDEKGGGGSPAEVIVTPIDIDAHPVLDGDAAGRGVGGYG